MSVDSISSGALTENDTRLQVRALLGGTTAMRQAGTRYLPKEIGESDDEYRARLSRSFLFNGLGKTITDMAGKVFDTDIQIGDAVPEDLQKMLENVDLSGRDLDTFAHDVFTAGLAEGISYILVDMAPPPVTATGEPRTLTVADAKAENRRPWMVHVRFEQVLGWRSENINGVDVLTQFRFKEDLTEADGEFGEKKVEQIRVFDRQGDKVTWSTYRRDETNKNKPWVLVGQGPVTIGKIAIAPFYAKRTGFMCGKPVLADLAEVNIAHWQSQSDQRNILHTARVPILFGAGLPVDQPISIGSYRMVAVSDPNAKLEYVEHSGAAIEAGANDLKALEEKMQVLGLELLIPTPGNGSATGSLIDEAHMNTPLAAMAIALQDALEQALGYMAEFAGVAMDNTADTLTINTDYEASLSPSQDGTMLLGAVDKKVIRRETWIKEMQRRGMIARDVDAADEVAAALLEGVDNTDPNLP